MRLTLRVYIVNGVAGSFCSIVEPAGPEYGGSEHLICLTGRRWKIDWVGTEREVEVQIGVGTEREVEVQIGVGTEREVEVQIGVGTKREVGTDRGRYRERLRYR